MKRLLQGLYALASYEVSMASLLYFSGFMINAFVPKGIDTGPVSGTGASLLVNAILLLAFLVPHSVMARPWFKTKWARLVPVAIERSTYILLAGMTLFFLVWQWRPMPVVLWSFGEGLPTILGYAFYALGWVMMLVSTVSIDHLAFFGLRPAWQDGSASAPNRATGLSRHGFYAFVRHPISLGWMLVLVSTPTMTVGHLLMAGFMVVYIVLVTPLEERDIEHELGDEYRDYRRTVRAFLPVRRS